MNLQNREKAFRILTRTIIGIFTISACCLILTSCEKDEYKLDLDQQFLMIAGELDHPETLILAENRAIYLRAVERMRDHLTIQNKRIHWDISSGSEIQVSEEIFNYMTKKYEELNRQVNGGLIQISLDKKGELRLFQRNGNLLKNNLIRLKSGRIEGDEDHRYQLDKNVFQSLMDGMRDYDPEVHNGINDIWDLSSGNFQASKYYQINDNFTYSGSTFNCSMSNGCATASSDDCELNTILSKYIYQENGGKYFFVIENIQGLPSVTISTYSRDGFEAMLEYLGW